MLKKRKKERKHIVVCTLVLLFYIYIAIFKIPAVCSYCDRRATPYTEKKYYNESKATSVLHEVALRKARHYKVLPACYRKYLLKTHGGLVRNINV